MNKLNGLTIKGIERAFEGAQVYAEGMGVPVTLERVAAFLRKPCRRLVAVAELPAEGLAPRELKVRNRLREIMAEVAANHVEHGMVKGNNPSIDKLCLTEHFGYGERPKGAGVDYPLVVFMGEDNLEE